LPEETLEVRLVQAPVLFELRRRVLRGGDPAAVVENPHDDEATSVHVAGYLGDRVVVCASFYASKSPVHEGVAAHQLRYMATDAHVQGRGFGTRVLARGCDELRRRGETEVWAKARDSALGFYRATGWHVLEGSEHVSVETDLPHTVIWRRLDGEPSLE
jgi:GNAT superfamily N-acetyltransferase